jgi:Zn-dependent peptidase ImmA (M78 family)
VTIFGERGVERIVVARHLDDHGSLVSQRRVRTTLGHEAGHGVLHTHLFALDSSDPPLFGDLSEPSAPRVLCKVDLANASGRTGRYEGDWAEFQANRAMGALLLPRILVQAAAAPYLMSVGTLGRRELDCDRSDEAIRVLAETFDVNPIAVRFRLEYLYPSSNELQGNL